MSTKFLMGNEAIAYGAVAAGVNFVSGYPGTPSTEILETTAKINDGGIYVEWSVNEKAAMEAAAGAAYSGARALVTMKQVGLNVASDPLMSLAYVGVKGGMVVVSADDPGPISSQTEQDTRHFASFSKLPVFDPSSPEEAYQMIQDAFELSERLGTPVLFRPTTRVCHAYADIEVKDDPTPHEFEGFQKDTMRWVIFPRTSYLNHIKIEKRNEELRKEFSSYPFNTITGRGKIGIATGGISYAYVQEALGRREDVTLFRVGTPFPFPEDLAVQFLNSVDQVLVIEELDPVIEEELLKICGKHHIHTDIFGKLTHHVQNAGENTVESVKKALSAFIEIEVPQESEQDTPPLPIRPPVLCAGCPHRGSFYAVKRAAKGRKAVFCGDIGCYTLGNAKPLDMTDTCLCMGADITIAHGMAQLEPDTLHFAFIGDSTFFASGITGMVNAVYNQSNITLIVLDNSTTAMTGHQPHPGTGKTMMGDIVNAVSIRKILEAIGVVKIAEADPLNFKQAEEAVRSVMDEPGVKAVLFKSPCVAITKGSEPLAVDESKCIGCSKCIRELGCPALSFENGCARIEPSLCTGCGLCAQVCPVEAILQRKDGAK